MISGADRRTFCVALLLACLGLPARAETGFTITDLLQQMRTVQKAEASFVERREMQLLTTPVVTKGRLTYVAPDRLEKLTTEPKRERMVVTSRDVTIEQANGETNVITLADAPELGALIDGLRATLAGDRDALERSYAATLTGTSSSWRLELLPRADRLKKLLYALTISGSGTWIERIDTVEANGDRSSMVIDRIK